MEKIEATVTGRVLEIHVQVGSKVNVGDDVAKIESMKIEIPVSAEYAGTVTAVAISVDDTVEEGQVIIELEG